MTSSTLESQKVDTLSRDAEGYFIPIDYSLLCEIIEISKDIAEVEDRDHREYLEEFDDIEIEYPENSFLVGN